MIILIVIISSVIFCIGDEVINTTTAENDENTTDTISVDINTEANTNALNYTTIDNSTYTIYEEICSEEIETTTENVEAETEVIDAVDPDNTWYADYSIEDYSDDEFVPKNITSFELEDGYVGGTIPLLNRKVHRGQRASIYEFPFVVSIRRNLAHYQIGVIMTKNIALTVAHGVYNVPIYELTLVYGENYSDRGTELAPIILCIIHQDFNPYTLRADLAIIRTTSDIMFKGNVKEILVLRSETMILDAEGTVVGWGRCDNTGKELCMPRSTEFFPNEISDPMLRSLKIYIDGTPYCDVYTHVMNLTLYPGMLCTGPSRLEYPSTPCMAVPGAPLVVYSYLVGLQSWGYGCGYRQDLPIIYTDIGYYTSWLDHEFRLLHNVTSKGLDDLLIGSESYLMARTLRTLRGMEPLKNEGDQKLEMFEIDQTISKLKGTVYDYRDFIFDGKYSQQKQDAYKHYREKRLRLLHHDKSRATECPEPFLRKEDKHYLFIDDNKDDDQHEGEFEEDNSNEEVNSDEELNSAEQYDENISVKW